MSTGAGGGASTGIFLTNSARLSLGLVSVPNEDASPLSAQEIKSCQDKAKLGVTALYLETGSGAGVCPHCGRPKP